LKVRLNEPPFFYFLLGSLLLHLFFLIFFFGNKSPLEKSQSVSFELVGLSKENPSWFSPPSVPSLPALKPLFPTLSKIEKIRPFKRISLKKVSYRVSRIEEITVKEPFFSGRNISSSLRIPVLPREETLGRRSEKSGKEDYFSRIRSLIEEAKIYPLKARLAGYEGNVKISFCILPDGQVSHLKILSPAPYKVLNEAAIKTIKRAAPFPPPPPRLSPPLKITLKMTFRLESEARF